MLLIFRKKLKGYQGLWFFVVGSACFELFFFITSILSHRNLPYFHLYALFEFLAGYWVIVTILEIQKQVWPKIILVTVSLYLIINPFIGENINNYNSISRSVESIMLLMFFLGYFYKVYQEETVAHLETLPSFWIVTGFIIYLAMGLFTHLLADYILMGSAKSDSLRTSYAFLNFSNILKNIAFSVGIWKANQ